MGVVSIKFKRDGRSYYFDDNDIELKKDEYVLVEGHHCSCYDFDESNWEATVYTREELKELLKDENCGLRNELKNFIGYYWN